MCTLLTTLADATNTAHWYEFRATDLVMVLAVLIAPWVAVFIQRRLDEAADKRRRKHAIFRALMATRAARVSSEHVGALNMIDIEFYGAIKGGMQVQPPADAKVVSAWREYLDSLNYGAIDDPAWHARVETSNEKFVNLLFEMSTALGYRFDKVLLKQGVYLPVAHGEHEQKDRVIRDGLARILSGQAPLGIMNILPDDTVALQNRVQQDMADVFAGNKPLRVEIAEPSRPADH